ncbi:MAG TPA: hypothetical protein VNW94_23420 [Streptosporangiaceae bacterium]|jgi:hypothetical protein|nr:hypothetical protein [Streptosporangiaceae bacterium]
MADFQLGRRPPKNAPALLLADFLTGQVPAHPVSADHFAKITDWGLWGNDTYGDCGPVSYGNLRKLISLYLAGSEDDITQNDVFALYTLVNPTFDPNFPGGPGDAGVDMQTMLELALQNGFAGRKPLGFAKVDISNLDEVRAAISIFGGVLLGVKLEVDQKTQTTAGGPWDFSQSPDWGGHAVLAGLYTSDPTAGQADVSVISWARMLGTTDAFEQNQLEEAWVVIFDEHLQHPAFQQGVDLAALADAYRRLTGRDFPVPVTAAPPQAGGGALQDVADTAKKIVGELQDLLHRHGL